MSLMKCPDCGKMVSDRASVCPECGCPAEYFINSGESANKALELSENSTLGIDNEMLDVSKKSLKQVMLDSLTKIFDWSDLMQVNSVMVADVQKRVDFDNNVTFVDFSNVETIINDIKNGSYSFPYVVAYIDLKFEKERARKYPVVFENGNRLDMYFDNMHFDAMCSPCFDIFAESEEQAEKIQDQLMDAYWERSEMEIVDFLNPAKKNVISLKYDDLSDMLIVNDENQISAYHVTVILDQTIWPLCIDESKNKVEYPERYILRKAQLAYRYSLGRDVVRNAINKEIRLYKELLDNLELLKNVAMGVGLTVLKKALEPVKSDEFMRLKECVRKHQPYTPDMVDAAFPNISLFYHNLPNDINERTEVETLKNRLQGVLDSYQAYIDKTGDELGIPKNLGVQNSAYSKMTQYMLTNEGLDVIIEALKNNPERSIANILVDYKKQLTGDIEVGYARRQEEREMEADADTINVFELAGDFVKHKKNQLEERQRKLERMYGDYRGTAGCTQNTKGTCAGCPHSRACIWGAGGKGTTW